MFIHYKFLFSLLFVVIVNNTRIAKIKYKESGVDVFLHINVQ